MVSERIIAARKRIEKRENWCQRSFHKNGASCAVGAFGIGEILDLDEEQKAALLLMQRVSPIESLTIYNDYHTHEEVLKLFDRAIEVALALEAEVVVVEEKEFVAC